ncbi:ErfK family protein [Clostridium bornimense]|uniref:ErfK family protein n=1 Tax=Clostridium bornimense TaxID=1216932 RepID=W6RV32_9CLOT|nr:L,D-transpeptidase family protein [Clostridium bornimense]CDM68188.1 ErfK family protein [Clostridium bornimense]
MKFKMSKWCISVIVSAMVIVSYIGVSIFFTNKFYFGSKINSVKATGKTVDEVNNEIEKKIKSYTLKIKGRDKFESEIKGSDIGLKYKSGDEVEKIKESQNPFGWIKGIFHGTESTISEMVEYDEELLKAEVDKLDCFKEENIVEPKNPTFKYGDKGYEIVDKVNGNKVNKDLLIENISKAIIDGKSTLNLDKVDCYEKPQYTKDSKEVKEAKAILDKYCNSKITYNINGKEEILDGSVINTWINIDNEFKVNLDKDSIVNYVDKLAMECNTIGNTRNFKSSLGDTVKVSGGNYGVVMDKEGEISFLETAIVEGKVTSREPEYLQTAFSSGVDDIGDTYVEVNLSSQHIWFYKKGQLITEGDVVTGNVSNNCATPTGVYRLNYKEKNATLKGEDYETPVSFWMPFNGGIGIHDATWRSAFGGNIYYNSGSHGCVNAPYDVANAIFDNIEPGTPIICYS